MKRKREIDNNLGVELCKDVDGAAVGGLLGVVLVLLLLFFLLVLVFILVVLLVLHARDPQTRLSDLKRERERE